MDLRMTHHHSGDVFGLKGFTTVGTRTAPTGAGGSDGGSVRGELSFGTPQIGEEYKAEGEGLPEGCRRVRVREIRPDGSVEQRTEIVCDIVREG